MLEEFTVDNFKSLINVTFRPHEQNLLLGMNNAGKTNLCQALMFLAESARHSLYDCADGAAPGAAEGLTNFYLAKPTIDFSVKASLPFEDQRLSFRYDLSLLRRTDGPSPSLEVQNESLRVDGGGFNDVLLIENKEGRARLLHEFDFAKGRQNYALATAPRGETMLRNAFDAENAQANRFKQYLTNWQYYALSVAAMRGAEHWPNVRALYHDGSNLASVICQLKTQNGREYRNLVESLKRVDPFVDEIDFQVPSLKRAFMFFRDKRRNSIPADMAPSGTLRYLALLYVLAGLPPEWAASSLSIIEEPENGIYVGYLKDLLDAASGGVPPRQLIFTSHSPYFVDLFEDRLDSVFVMKRGDSHSTITQPDPELVKKRLEKFPLGEQHFREMLG